MRLLVIGLDSMPADALFSMKDELPNIGRMIDDGVAAVLESCHPPITIPAWMVMMTGRSPGSLGIYGFRHRKGYSYTEGWIANSTSVKAKKVWDYLAENGLRSCLVGVPPSYPPYPVNGSMISCFITPSEKADYTYPRGLRQEVESLVGKYIFDVVFRTEDRDAILKDIYEMTERRFKVIKYLLSKERWDYFMFVEIGVDRLHHAFWKFHDRNHPKYVPRNRYEDVVREYYRFIDGKIGELLQMVDDDTCVMLVSDHGTTSMKGAFCINEWLIEKGYLVLKSYPDGVTDLDKCDVDWGRTKAWGWGGYYARIFLNVKGREAQGTIAGGEEYERFRDELAREIMDIRGPRNERWDTRVYKPELLYRECNGDKPDLMVYFDNLYWRSEGSVGHRALYLSENNTGPDDSVHWYDGVFILYSKRKK
ncbi:MAG: alkaline phosphatase family protein, partial [Candidatus Nitrosocaldus sp.]|nr:alkaline phosphatase family protein [Candidatus Nitrosocaldus sp.]